MPQVPSHRPAEPGVEALEKPPYFVKIRHPIWHSPSTAFTADGGEMARYKPAHKGLKLLPIDAVLGKAMITRRFATVEPGFGNLRGSAKVDGQWKRYCLMHNIEKLAHPSYAA